MPPGFDGVSQPTEQAIKAFYASDKTYEAPGGRGKTRWDTVDVDTYIRGPEFTSAFNVQNYKEGDEIVGKYKICILFLRFWFFLTLMLYTKCNFLSLATQYLQ